MYLTRISTGGIVQPPIYSQVGFGTDDQFNAALASQGGGYVVTAWDQRSATLISSENVHSVRVDANWNLSSDQDVGVGWHRQIYMRTATNGNQHLAVFLSQGGGLNRILAQRLDASGNPLVLEPVVLFTTSEGYTGISTSAPEVAFNGSVYLVVWTLNGSVYGSRLQADGTLLDPSPVTILTNNATSAAVAAVGDTFYVAYTYTFSGNQQSLKGVRVNAANLSVIGSPASIGTTGYDLNPVVRAFGNRWLVVWESQISHDNLISTIRGRLIEANGTVGTVFAISTSGDADNPDVAVGNSRAFIVWNETAYQEGRIRARMLNQDGSFFAGQFLVCDAPNRQFYPAAAYDGVQFTTAWTDYRGNVGEIEQLRGDIYAARVTLDGTVIDPNGIQLTSGPLPEDLPAAAAATGKTLIIFSKLNGANSPEIQRLGYRVLSVTPGNVDVTLTPINPPIIIPAQGGSFSFTAQVANNGTTPATFDAWIMQYTPQGQWQGPMIGPVNLIVPGGITVSRLRNQNVPGSASPGVYTYRGYVGFYATVKWDSSSFDYTKSGSRIQDSGFSDWSCTGEPFPGEIIAVSSQPSVFSLIGATPNPFNPTTVVKYQMPDARFVSLKIYDVSGRMVATLVEGWQEAGDHQVTFDGSKLSSGLYFVKMQAGDFSAVRKVMLVK
jgi:hypothetical protein